MGRRLELHFKLVGILESDNVYFQPPRSVEMKYPAIVYKREYILSDWADNKPRLLHNRYLVTVIDRDPDSQIPDKIAALPKCSYDRFYIADNLNHNVFKLFF